MLDSRPDGLGEGDRVGYMPAITAEPRSRQFPFRDRRACPGTIPFAQVPRVTEIILSSRTVDLRFVRAVNIKEVITFAKPRDFGLRDTHDRTHVMSRRVNV